MSSFWLSGFFNSDAGGRVIIIIYYGGCGLQDQKLEIAEDLMVFNFNNLPSIKLDSNTTLVFSNIFSMMYVCK